MNLTSPSHTECYIVLCFVRNQKWELSRSVWSWPCLSFTRGRLKRLPALCVPSAVCNTVWRPCSNNRSILLASCKLAVRVWDMWRFSKIGSVPKWTNWKNFQTLLRNSIFKFKPAHTDCHSEMGVCFISVLKLLFEQVWTVFFCHVGISFSRQPKMNSNP